MRLQIHLRELLIWVALFGASLALARVSFVITAVLVTAGLSVAALAKWVPDSVVWGYVFGIVAVVACALLVAFVWGERPFASRSDPETSLAFARTYAFPVGGFLGITVALLWNRMRRMGVERDPQVQ